MIFGLKCRSAAVANAHLLSDPRLDEASKKILGARTVKEREKAYRELLQEKLGDKTGDDALLHHLTVFEAISSHAFGAAHAQLAPSNPSKSDMFISLAVCGDLIGKAMPRADQRAGTRPTALWHDVQKLHLTIPRLTRDADRFYSSIKLLHIGSRLLVEVWTPILKPGSAASFYYGPEILDFMATQPNPISPNDNDQDRISAFSKNVAAIAA
jgi:hypothetical protein